ncbi:DUF6318 family protein [Actinopolymorpha alba]|uniref:DUF6318 family protein n=1 Tax=Actinopolymorpha alba TaxID=533267 RepID=UPI003B51544F
MVFGALQACAGPPVKPEPPSSRHASTTEPTLPTLPETAKTKSLAGAKAFALHYYEAWRYAYESKDWKQLRELSMSNCRQCRDPWSAPPGPFLDGAPAIEEHQGHIAGDKALFAVRRTSPSGAMWVPTPGASPTPCSNENWSDEFELRYRDGGWKVVEIRIDPVIECNG